MKKNRNQHNKETAPAAFDKLIGEDPKFKTALLTAQKAAQTDDPILILGASGTGKELLARAIHQSSRRAEKPFVDVNCSAIPDTLIESELFGYERGAFTGAKVEGRSGYFDEAHGGTLLLDEIGDASHPVQAKLLRVLEDGSFRRIGGNRSIKVDVRIISSTNRDLSKLMAENKIREDLFYRLNTFTLYLPPLTERKADVALLIDHFLRFYARREKKDFKLLPATMRMLEEYHWPGNVRELKGVIAYAVSMSEGTIISPRFLPLFFHTKKSPPIQETLKAQAHSSGFEQDFKLKNAVRQFEKDLIQEVMDKWKNKTEAIRILGISRRSFYLKLKQYGLDKKK
ncbi:MAG: sigma 54-interacting transcriptional regulator [Thermodesulfobacteriota bacterium]